GCGIDLNIRRVRAPGGRAAEVLAAPEAEADGEPDVGASGEGLLPGAANGERVVLRERALGGAPRIDGKAEGARERAELRSGVGPEDPVARDDEGSLGARERVDLALDGGGVGGAAE